METILISTLVVATAEFGDKTQLLAILLAARFRAPVPIMLGILGATLFNHGLAAFFGWYASDDFLPGDTLRWVLAVRSSRWRSGRFRPTSSTSRRRCSTRFGAFLATPDRVLHHRDRRQDAGRDHRARGALSERCRGDHRDHARHDDRQYSRGLSGRDRGAQAAAHLDAPHRGGNLLRSWPSRPPSMSASCSKPWRRGRACGARRRAR